MFGLSPKVPEIEAKDVKEAIDLKKDFVIVDVRTPGEIEKGKIENSISIPLDRISTVSEKITDKEKTIYVYCLSGSRSSLAVDRMLKMGYKQVFSMKSGLLAWRAGGYSLV